MDAVARSPERPAFRRQHPVGPYVLDFYCAKAQLAVEIDGIGHDMGSRPQRDLQRDAWLKERGITVVRIAASDLNRIDDIADGIVRLATEIAAHPLHRPSGGPPPPLREGG
jgi:very-short-patch-repair endonuclease